MNRKGWRKKERRRWGGAVVVVMGQKRLLGRPVERDKLEGQGKAGSRVVGSSCLFFSLKYCFYTTKFS